MIGASKRKESDPCKTCCDNCLSVTTINCQMDLSKITQITNMNIKSKNNSTESVCLCIYFSLLSKALFCFWHIPGVLWCRLVYSILYTTKTVICLPSISSLKSTHKRLLQQSTFFDFILKMTWRHGQRFRMMGTLMTMFDLNCTIVM